MADGMINSTSPTPKKGVSGIGDTHDVHYKEYDMNILNNPIGGEANETKPKFYTKGQSK